MFGIAADIGYSQNKTVFGKIGEAGTTVVMPAGAGPIKNLSRKSLDADIDAPVIEIDGEAWVTCVEPSVLENFERSLDSNYSKTNQYLALLRGSLLEAGSKVVDVLTVGLPIAQYKDEQFRTELKDMLEGEHVISPKFTVNVKYANVQPQAVGAYMAICNRYANNPAILSDLMNGLVLLADQGYFSLDWVLVDEGRLQMNSCGSSTWAMSEVVSRVQGELAKKHYVRLKTSRLERMLRTGDLSISAHGEFIEIEPLFNDAAKSISESIRNTIGASLRHTVAGDGGVIQRQPSIACCVGGGAHVFKTIIAGHFPESMALDLKEPQLLNVEGFWLSTLIEANRIYDEVAGGKVVPAKGSNNKAKGTA